MSHAGTGAVISGIGQSDVGRRLGRSGLSLTIDAALDALADSGLHSADIDGLSTYPGLDIAGSLLRAWETMRAIGVHLVRASELER